ncbi:hypothetical protein ACET3Z_018662 [Daucus carota]
MSGKSAKFVGSRSSSAKSAGFSGFNTTSNILYGITEDDSDILQLEERKGRRGNLETLGHDDIEMGLENSGPGGLAFRGGANISREDLVAPAYMARWGRVFFHKFREKIKLQKSMIESLKDREDDDGIQQFLHYKLGLLQFQSSSCRRESRGSLKISLISMPLRVKHNSLSYFRFHGLPIRSNKVEKLETWNNAPDVMMF